VADATIPVTVRLFAGLRELAGRKEAQLELPAGARAGDVYAALDLGPEPAGLRYAVNRAYADRDAPLAAGDEVAVIPPVSGGGTGQASVQVSISAAPLDVADVLRAVTEPAAGATASFIGTVRDRARGRTVLHLEYEAFEEMALDELRRIADEAAVRHGCLHAAVAHRTGRVEIGEASVAIAVSAAHRHAALAACSEIIERLKHEAPIWKKERYEGGEEWIGQGS
jgi:molybdopterin synthase catalytic subunit